MQTVYSPTDFNFDLIRDVPKRDRKRYVFLRTLMYLLAHWTLFLLVTFGIVGILMLISAMIFGMTDAGALSGHVHFPVETD